MTIGAALRWAGSQGGRGSPRGSREDGKRPKLRPDLTGRLSCLDVNALVASLSSALDFQTGRLNATTSERSVTLASMASYFADQDAVRKILAEEGDRVLYDVAVVEPESRSPYALAYGTTRVYPGCVGREYHMTKGHFHREKEAPEIYLGLQGEGGLLVMTAEGEASFQPVRNGTVVYVPGGCAHRLVNTGSELFVTLAVYPVTAGHDYGPIAQRGFSTLVLEGGGKPILAPNERWKGS